MKNCYTINRALVAKKRLLLTFCLATLATIAVHATTITWDEGVLRGHTVSPPAPFTNSGITLSSENGSADFSNDAWEYTGSGSMGGIGSEDFTFTSTVGNFTRIEIYCNNAYNLNSNWSQESGKVVWTGDASSVRLGEYIPHVTQIVFTIGSPGIIWDEGVLRGNDIDKYHPFTNSDITLSVENGSADFSNDAWEYIGGGHMGGYDDADFTFTSTVGNFTRIEIYCDHVDDLHLNANWNWDGSHGKAVWTGDASSIHYGRAASRVTKIVFTMEAQPSTASITTLPAAVNGLVYTGSAQTLITAGTAEGGEMQYKLGDGEWSTELPTATAEGVYAVYYKVVGDAEHEDYTPTPNQLNISIADVGTWDGNLSTTTTNKRAKNGTVITGTLATNVKISIVSGATVTLRDATINGVNNPSYEWAGLTCEGDAVILLERNNTVKGYYHNSGIFVPVGSTLSIAGVGTLHASAWANSAGIGGGSHRSCGNITINGGTIIATRGNEDAQPIGEGYDSSCGTVTIADGMIDDQGSPIRTIGPACGEHLIWNFNSGTGTLTISGTGSMYNYEVPGPGSEHIAPWNPYRTAIQHVVIEDGATSIGQDAFYYESNLQTVSLPSSLTSIGFEAFFNCSQLTTINLPEGLTSIGEFAFEDCYGLTIVELPSTLTTIRYGAFEYCTHLTDVYVNWTSLAGLSTGSNVFMGVNTSSVKLHVPLGTRAMYATASPWSGFMIVDKLLPGKFSISSTQQISFSSGNLQYLASANTWDFAVHQYDFIGNNPGNTTASGRDTQTDWIDLFGWGTSGYDNRHPWQNYSYPFDPGYYADTENDIFPDGYDWGIYNASHLGAGWRTLTKDEWNYLVFERPNASSLCTHATVNGVQGFILMPDSWQEDGVALSISVSYSGNTISASDWTTLDGQGCVFLPAAGRRNESAHENDFEGNYWTSMAGATGYANVFAFWDGTKEMELNFKSLGFSVRLAYPLLPFSITAAPTAKTGLVYNGSAQALVNAGTAEDGTMQYRIGTGAWGTAIPTATDAGTYNVYYKVVGDAYHANSEVLGPIAVKIATITETPLTFEAKVAGATVSYTISSGTLPPVEYSTDGFTWTTYSEPITLANVGDKVYFRGNNATYRNSSKNSARFSCTEDCYLYGNIMSLVDATNFASNTTLTENHTFYTMFYNNTRIKNHTSKDLVLPATTLTENCYESMFSGCTGLTSAPALPATTLADDCYLQMFSGCTGLTSASALPATTLANQCCQSMFYNCTGLASAPELPATTLADGCYLQMFSGCTGLTSAPELPATTLANSCYSNMFSDCTGLTSAPALPATTLATSCYMFMFQNCTGLTGAPELPATTLAEQCYHNMFSGCTGLTTAPELPATTLATSCYMYMFEGCTDLTSAPELPATTLANQCYCYMFSGCTGLTSAPVLPATTLANLCYYYMFNGCTNLSSVTCYATSRASTYATTNWLNGVAASGTFYAPDNNVFASDERGGSSIPVGWNVVDIMYTQPLTFEAKEAGATVSYSVTYGDLPEVEYSTDGSTWNTYSSAITLANVGDKVSFRGNNATYKNSYSQSAMFSCSKDCYLYGNIMSLVNKTEYASATELTEDYTFIRLFTGNEHIKNHASKELVLPATTLTRFCYMGMFSGCTGLTSAPELPATNLETNCYVGMFMDCTGLTSAPELPATTLASNCYESMFNGCLGLTSAPALPATTLADDCYENMFNGCFGLTSAPALPATTLAEMCYYAMFRNCISLTSAPALPATTLAEDCYYRMFDGCTNLTSAPALPATTLAGDCYNSMFYDCTGLTSAPELPALLLADYCYAEMFSGCTGLTSAPELPAISMAIGCYEGMFSGCTGLTSAPELTAPTLIAGCYARMFSGCSNLASVTCWATYRADASDTEDWLLDVAASGTFYAPANGVFNELAREASAIPVNWNVSLFTASVADAPTGKTGLVYTGEAQSLLQTAGMAENGTMAYRVGDTGDWSTDIPTGTDAATYNVYYKAAGSTIGNASYADSDVGGPIAVTIDKAASSVTAPTAKSDLGYTGSAQALVTAGSATGGAIEYRIGTGVWSTAVPEATNADTYVVGYRVIGDANHTDLAEATVNVTIAKAASSVTAPTAKDLTYTGSAQALVNAGTPVGGTIEYRIGTGAWGTAIPETTNADTYTVGYRVIGDANHNDLAEATVNVTIAKAASSVTAPTAKELTYTGSAQALVNAGTPVGGTIEYRIGTGVWSTAVPEATNADTYVVGYRVIGDANHNDLAEATVNVTIAKAASSVTAPNAKELTYTGSAQALVNAGTPVGGTIEYRIGDGSWGTSIPEATDAATYVVGYRVIGDANHTDLAEATVIVTIAKAASSVTAPTAKELTYTGSAQALVNAGIPVGGTIEYRLGTGVWGTAIPEATDADTYVVGYRVIGDANHNDLAEATVNVTIAKAASSVTAPTAKELTYTGSAQALVNAGSATGGTIEYRIGTDAWGTAIPEATDADTYVVGYRVICDANHTDLAEATLNVTIAKAASSVTAPTAKELTYTGSAQALVNAGIPVGGTIEYRLGDGVWGTAIPEATDAATYVVGYRVIGDANHNDLAEATVNVTIDKAASSVTAPTAKELTYTGNAQALVNAGTPVGGTIEYRIGTGAWGTSIPEATDAATYVVGYRVIGDANHNDLAEATVNVIVAKAASSVTAPTAKELTYTGSAQALVNAGTPVGGTIEYRIGTGAWGTSIPEATDAATYVVGYRVIGDANHNDLAEATVNVIVAKAASSVTAPTAINALVYTGSAQALVNAGTPVGGTIEYRIGTGAWGTSIPEATDAATYVVGYRVIGDANHNDLAEATVNVIVAKAASSVTAPTAINALVYTGSAQALVNAGTPVGGTIEYRIGDGAWGTSIPEATDAATYVVSYRVLGDANHTDLAEATVNVTIAKAASSVTTAPTAISGLVYTGVAQTLVEEGAAAGGTMHYSLNGTDWATALPQGLNATTYTVHYKVVGDANHMDLAEATVNVTIAQAPLTVTADNKAVIYGDVKPIYTVSYSGFVGGENESVLGGTLTFACDYEQGSGVATYDIMPSGLTSSNYAITFVKGTLTVNNAASSVTTAPAAISGLVFTGSAQALVTAGTADGGIVHYSFSADGPWSAAVPAATNADTYNVYYKSVGNSGYSDSEVGGPIAITIAKAASSVTAPTAKELTYTGSAQALVNAGIPVGGTIEYRLGDGVWGTAIPEATDAATYVVGYRVIGDANHNDLAEATVNVTIDKAASSVTAPTAKELTYTGNAQALVNAGIPAGGTIEYRIGDGVWGTVIPEATDADTYVVGYRVIGDANHNDLAEATVNVTIAKAASSVTAPTAKELTYTGSAQALVNAGIPVGGTIEYRLGDGIWGTAIPEATDAATYVVGYRVIGDANHTDLAEATVNVTIAKAASSVTAPTAKELTYTGNAQALVNAGTPVGGTIEYRIGTGDWATSIPEATDAATYAVGYRVIGDANHNDLAEATVNVTIAKAASSVTAPTAKELTYTGSAQALVNAGIPVGGTIEYRIGDGAWGTSIPEATDANTYVVGYRVIGDANHNDLAEATVNVTIAKAASSVTTAPTAISGLVYTGVAQTLVEEGAAAGGTMHYSLNGTDWATALPQGLNATTYTVHYKVVGDANHMDLAEATVNVTIAQAPLTVTADNKAVIYGDVKPIYTVSYSGFVGGENESVLGGTLAFACDYEQGSGVATYDIMPSGLTSSNYGITFVKGTLTVGKAAASLVVPTANELTYTAATQTLIAAGEAIGGTMQYSLDGTNWSTDLPQGFAAGSYTVHYRVVGDDNHTDVAEATLAVTIAPAILTISGAIVETAKFEDGNAEAKVTHAGTLNGVQGAEAITHTSSASYDNAAVGEHKTITIVYTLVGDETLLANYQLAAASEVYTSEGAILAQITPDTNAEPSIGGEPTRVQQGIEVNIYGYCSGSTYSLRYHLASGNPNQYKIDYDDARIADVDWTDMVTTDKEGMIDVILPDDLPTGDYSLSVRFRDGRFQQLESAPITISLHVNLPDTYTAVLFDDVIALVDTCNCLTDIQWYHRANSTEAWQAIPGATGYYHREEGGLIGEYFVHVKVNGEETYTCPQTDMQTLYNPRKSPAKVSIWPNPVVENAWVSIEGSENFDHTLRIVDLMGVEVDHRTFEGNTVQIDMSSFASGHYMVSVDGIVVKVIRK